MRVREFTGADFEAASKLLGTTRHARHGARSYWHGADELCGLLARSDQGFVVEGPDGGASLAGIMLLASPRDQDHNHDLRSHWRQQRTTILAVSRTLGIHTREDVGAVAEDPHPLAVERLGTDAPLVILLQVDPQTCDEADEKRLFERGLAWLAEHGVEAAEVAGSDEPQILVNDAADNGAVDAIVNDHAAKRGLPFVPCNYHIEQDGRLVAGIVAWMRVPDLHIDLLGVDEAARGQGLGGRLLAHVEEQARQAGCTTASIDTFSFQAPDYYPAHGYEEVWRYRLDDGTERIYFSKRLRAE